MEISRNGTLHVPRITQIDSKYLDHEVFNLLKSAILKAFKYANQATFVELEPEIETSLKLFLNWFTIGKHNQSIGQQLLHIQYKSNNKFNLNVYYILPVIATWFRKRFVKSSQFSKSFEIVELVYQILEFLNLFAFLIEGQYPSLAERMFSIQVIPSTTAVRKVSYAYFMRELLWNGFAELLATSAPLIPFKLFYKTFYKFLPSYLHEETDLSGKYDHKDESNIICTICNSFAILPCKYGCKHVACYYCINSALALTVYDCSLCGYKVENTSDVVPLS